MIYGLYSMRDTKAGFSSLSVEQSDAIAERNFRSAVLNDTGLIHNFPDDFHLYKVGTFDLDSGKIEPLPVICYMLSAGDVLHER